MIPEMALWCMLTFDQMREFKLTDYFNQSEN